MTKKLKIEGIDAVGILNSIRPMSEPLKKISSVANTRRATLEIDETQCLTYIKENPISKQLETKRKKAKPQKVVSEVSTPSEQTEFTNQVKTPIQKRIGEKTKEEALEQYRQTFLQIPKIEDRKPVFVSCHTRNKLDEIVRRLGGRKMSVSGLIENLALHHLELYGEDIELWRKL